MRKMSFEETVERCRAIHGDRFTYSSLVEGEKQAKIRFVCQVHGEMVQLVSNHTRNNGCALCGKAELAKGRLDSLESIASKAAKVHPNRGYLYNSIGPVVNRSRSLEIVCPLHGAFTQLVHNHLAGGNCPVCARAEATDKDRLSIENSAEKVKTVHGDKYEVLSFNMVGGKNTVTAKCSYHGEFTVQAGQFIGGRKCPQCTAGELSWNLYSVIEKCQELHGNTYVYIGIFGPSRYRKLQLVCKEHGSFNQGLASHLNRKAGCPKCADARHSSNMLLTHAEILSRSLAVHGNTYKVARSSITCVAKQNKGTTTAVCIQHGEFTVYSSDFLRGQGCPKCSLGGKSKLGTEFVEYIKSLAPDAEEEVAIRGTRYKWDSLVRSKGLAFEFHGLYWHSEEYRHSKYHKEKHDLGLTEGVRTIHIFEDEWVLRKSAVKEVLQKLLLASSLKVHARLTEVGVVSTAEADTFFEAHHIQGCTAGSAYLGLYSQGSLVAVVGYALRKSGRGQRVSLSDCEITRYATSVSVVGGFSKLLANLKKRHKEVTEVYTFSDIRTFTGGMYKATGFKVLAELAPDYFYVRGGKRQRKSTLQKSNFKNDPKLLYDETLTERELATLNNFHRVYDCGKLKWGKTL